MRSGSPSWTWCWKLVICCIFLVASFIRATVCLTLTRCTSPSPPSRGTAGEICSSKYDPSLLSLCCESVMSESHKKLMKENPNIFAPKSKEKKHFNLSQGLIQIFCMVSFFVCLFFCHENQAHLTSPFPNYQQWYNLMTVLNFLFFFKLFIYFLHLGNENLDEHAALFLLIFGENFAF